MRARHDSLPNIEGRRNGCTGLTFAERADRRNAVIFHRAADPPVRLFSCGACLRTPINPEIQRPAVRRNLTAGLFGKYINRTRSSGSCSPPCGAAARRSPRGPSGIRKCPDKKSNIERNCQQNESEADISKNILFCFQQVYTYYC